MKRLVLTLIIYVIQLCWYSAGSGIISVLNWEVPSMGSNTQFYGRKYRKCPSVLTISQPIVTLYTILGLMI